MYLQTIHIGHCPSWTVNKYHLMIMMMQPLIFHSLFSLCSLLLPPLPQGTGQSILGHLDLLGKLNCHEAKPLVLWLQSLREISANGSVSINFIMLLDEGKAGPSPIFLTGYQSDVDYG